MKRFKWCRRCGVWRQHLCKGSKVCVDCVEKSQSKEAMSNRAKGVPFGNVKRLLKLKEEVENGRC